MFTHTAPVLTSLLHSFVAPTRLPDLAPMLFSGPLGTGKRHHILAFLRDLGCTQHYHPFTTQQDTLTECHCDSCQRLTTKCHPDVLTLTGQESIADFRTSVVDFINHQPLQLPYRFLTFANLHRYPKDTLDTALKTIEEPPRHLKIFATTTDAAMMPPAVLSRFRTFQTAPLTAAQLAQIVKTTPRLASYAKHLDTHPWTGVSAVALYVQYDFDTRFRELFADASVITLDATVRKFTDALKSDPDHAFGDLIELFLGFYVARTLQFCDLNLDVNPTLARFRAEFIRLVQRLLGGFGRYLKAPNAAFFISIDAQLLTFFLTVTTLRRTLEHKQ